MSKLVLDFIAACHEVDRMGLAYCSSGNMSCRTERGTVLLTATGSWFGRINLDMVSVCSLDNGEVKNNIRPSVESRFHLGILRKKEDINVVLHFQSPYATAIAAGRQLPENFNVILEMPYYIGKPVMIDFLPPGSQELADAVVEAAGKSAMIIIQNHGMVTYGKSFDEAIQRAKFFELACQVICNQRELSYISNEMIGRLITA